MNIACRMAASFPGRKRGAGRLCSCCTAGPCPARLSPSWPVCSPVPACFSPISPGHGHSSPDAAATLPSLADDLAAWLTAVAPGPVVLGGWSLGGMVALELAARTEIPVDKLLLLATTPRFTMATDWPHGLPDTQVRALRRNLERRFEATLGDFFALAFAEGEVAAERLRAIRTFAIYPGGLPDHATAAALLELLAVHDQRAILPAISCPALVLHGTLDRVTPAGAGRALAAALPQGQLHEIAGAGHAPLWTRPARSCRRHPGVLRMGPVNAIDGRLLRTHFSSHAGDYDRYAAVQKRVVAQLAARLAATGPLTGLVLDIGTGTGALAAELGGNQTGRTFVLADIAHGMTRAAAQRLPGALACDGDARKLPFSNSNFTAVISSNVYQWVDDLQGLFARPPASCAPVAVSPLPCSVNAPSPSCATPIARLSGSMAAAHASHVQNFPSAAEVAAALESAGLVCRNFASFLEIDWHPDVPSLLRQLKQIGASNAAADRPKGMASREIMQRMIALYEKQHRQRQGVPATYEVVCAIAGKS